MNARIHKLHLFSSGHTEDIKAQVQLLDDLHNTLRALASDEQDLPESVRALNPLERESVELEIRRDIQLVYRAITSSAVEGQALHESALSRFREVRRKLIRADLRGTS
jgi:hypothetical protein